ncbi:hypothetical protein RN001_010903 [Aquatica leii]|uniref:PXA domain-containing protein n=1 Tax=Aquatica leii TaxID=1421715 RepID=A0AAN7P797_9COLE|nr:hypothetical protein RN001_010903 [Aquatica leii]
MWITFYYLRNVLLHNKPYEYDFERNKFLKFVAWIYTYRYAETGVTLIENKGIVEDEIDSGEAPIVVERHTKSIDERIDILVKDIQVRFILKWYLHISTDPYFLSESKHLIDDIIRHFLQIIIDVDGRKLVHGCSVIFLKHLKEFRKSLKRSQKNGRSVEDLYRYSHIGSKSKKASEYFIYQLTLVIFRQFINWELWNSLPCQSIVSILSKRFTTYILAFVSTPGYLNYKMVEACASDDDKARLNLKKYYYISLSDVDHTGNLNQLSPGIKDEYNTPKISPKRTKSDLVFTQLVEDEVDFKKPSPPMKVDSDEVDSVEKYKVSEPVKIYESKSSSNKTWRNSSDLECISLGQDLLTFQEFNDPEVRIQQLIEKKLWKDNADVVDEEKASMWDVVEPWDGEQEVTDAVAEVNLPSTNFQHYLKSTANNALKPIGDVTTSTLHNMKELQQTTVHNMSQATTNAMHKIGDLQDEAAGMVEGIFDFGMAGLRKGLRLTGLQENLSELTQKAKNEFHDLHKTIDMQIPITTGKITEAIRIIDHDLHKHKASSKLVKTPHVASEEKIASSSESDESVWMNPLTTKETPSFEGDILLERTPDAPKSLNDVIARSETEIPKINEEMVVTESPDPEYEDTQDFASTIAKLRSLLQQKSESGLTTPSLSPMPQDDALKTPLEPDAAKTNGAMPSLYKFCTRTATGVLQNTLNTIKTALPGNTTDASQLPSCNSDWTFIEADYFNNDFNLRVKKLLSERQAYCTVDTAYEAIHSLEIVDQPDIVPSPPIPFEDELDEFDLHVPITKVLLDIICELIDDTKICLLQETVIKALLLLVGNYTEDYVTKQSDALLHNVNKIVGKLPESSNHEVLPMKLDEMVHICLKKFPGVAKNLLGADTIEAGAKMFISSLQSPKINQDVFMQVFELFASELINACSQSSPAYSA